jgi:GTP pyrophosphokinase
MADTVLTASAERHHEAFEELLSEVEEYNPEVDRDLLERAYRFACEAHEGQQRRSGEDFVSTRSAWPRSSRSSGSDESTLAAALVHDVVEDTPATIEEVRAEFGDDVATLVEGVTKLTAIQFQSREQAQAENYRKMIVAMAQDPDVILIKLATASQHADDRVPGQAEAAAEGARDARGLRAARASPRYPLHQVGARGPRLRDAPSAQVLRDPGDGQPAPSRSREVRRVRRQGSEEGARQGRHPADISFRAKHFYSIYEKMAKRGKEFNEIYDLTAMRVLVDRDGKEGERDCYGALGVIHSLWKPMPGRFKDYVAMPKFNMYRSLHTTVIGPEGKPLEIQVRTREMHRRPSTASPRTGSTREEGEEGRGRAARLDAAARRLAGGGIRSARVPPRVPGARLRRGLRLHARRAR